jgi:hypothetical protein
VERRRRPVLAARRRAVARDALTTQRWPRPALYRQAALLARFGGTDLARNTLAASVVRVGQAVQPVINLLRDALLDSPLVYGDETAANAVPDLAFCLH